MAFVLSRLSTISSTSQFPQHSFHNSPCPASAVKPLTGDEFTNSFSHKPRDKILPVHSVFSQVFTRKEENFQRARCQSGFMAVAPPDGAGTGLGDVDCGVEPCGDGFAGEVCG